VIAGVLAAKEAHGAEITKLKDKIAADAEDLRRAKAEIETLKQQAEAARTGNWQQLEMARAKQIEECIEDLRAKKFVQKRYGASEFIAGTLQGDGLLQHLGAVANGVSRRGIAAEATERGVGRHPQKPFSVAALFLVPTIVYDPLASMTEGMLRFFSKHYGCKCAADSQRTFVRSGWTKPKTVLCANTVKVMTSAEWKCSKCHTTFVCSNKRFQDRIKGCQKLNFVERCPVIDRNTYCIDYGLVDFLREALVSSSNDNARAKHSHALRSQRTRSLDAVAGCHRAQRGRREQGRRRLVMLRPV
jgi:hypothetical protein